MVAFQARYVPSRFTAVGSIVVGLGLGIFALSSGLMQANPIFALLWLAMVTAMVGANAYFLATGRWLMGPRVEVDGSGADSSNKSSGTVGNRLRELDRLKREGAVTESEYAGERRRILDTL